jgi:hypothetical protein
VNREIRDQWTAALRSGEYQQAKGFLNVKTPLPGGKAGLCCLGVLCEVAVKAGVIEAREITWGIDEDGNEERLISYSRPDESNVSVLPSAVMEWAHTGDPNPIVTAPGINDVGLDRVTLAGLNDKYDCSFAQIADVIEASL